MRSDDSGIILVGMQPTTDTLIRLKTYATASFIPLSRFRQNPIPLQTIYGLFLAFIAGLFMRGHILLTDMLIRDDGQPDAM